MLKILFILPVIGSLCAMAQDTQGNAGAPISGEVLSSKVDVLISPYPQEEQATTSGLFNRPTGNADTTQKLPCRPAAPKQENIQKILDWIRLPAWYKHGTHFTQNVSSDEPTSVSVSGNWLKLGLVIITEM